jgi:hypothetical protein
MVGAEAGRRERELRVPNKINRTGAEEQQDKTQDQNLPKMETQNTNGAAKGLRLVGIGSSRTHGKEPHRTVPHHTRFHDHLVLESKPHFMIILRLENAGRLAFAAANPGGTNISGTLAFRL